MDGDLDRSGEGSYRIGHKAAGEVAALDWNKGGCDDDYGQRLSAYAPTPQANNWDTGDLAWHACHPWDGDTTWYVCWVCLEGTTWAEQ